MMRLMPTELVPLVGLMVLVLAWPPTSQPTGHARLVGGILLFALVASAAYAMTSALYWWDAQQW
jgi:hypothetical protein